MIKEEAEQLAWFHYWNNRLYCKLPNSCQQQNGSI